MFQTVNDYDMIVINTHSDAPAAEVAVKSSRLIFVFAKKPGAATLYPIDENENVLANISSSRTNWRSCRRP